MSAVNAEIRSLALQVATSIERQAGASSASDASHQPQHSLPTSITLYRTGRVLYSCHYATSDTNGRSGSSSNNAALVNAFDSMISNLPPNYVNDALLHNLHHAFASLILSYGKSSSATTTSSPAIISALSTMIGKQPNLLSSVSYSFKDVVEGTESLCGIYLSSITACRNICCNMSLASKEGRQALELPFVSFSWVYDYLLSNNNNNAAEEEDDDDGALLTMQKCILNTLSRLLVHGIIEQKSSTTKNNNEEEEEMDEEISNIMNVIENIQSSIGEYNCALGDMLAIREEGETGEQQQSFVTALLSKFQSKDGSQPPQLQYLLAMLRASPKSTDRKKSPSSITIDTVANKAEVTRAGEEKSQPQKNMTEIQIEHVKSILPDLGEGYIEEALKCYNHDVERTLEALLQASEGSGGNGNNNNNGNIHPRLLTIPQNLPRKLKESVDHYSANVNLHRGATTKDDGKEAVKIQKQHIRHVEKQAEDEAFLIENVSRTLGGMRVSTEGDDDDDDSVQVGGDEYDDDYDE